MVRRGHPFEGQALQVLWRTHRAGRLYFLLILPDQSRSLIPADWTDLAEPTQSSSREPGQHPPLLGSLADLLKTRALVDALLYRSTNPEEFCHAPANESALSGKSAAQPGDLGTPGQRPTRCRARQTGATDRQNCRDRNPSGGTQP
ncbi:MAG: hypothetical protein HGA75_18125 [Thiobacillus sp.]|nr:hypothetical protein [Thiobacillus sp.]